MNILILFPLPMTWQDDRVTQQQQQQQQRLYLSLIWISDLISSIIGRLYSC